MSRLKHYFLTLVDLFRQSSLVSQISAMAALVLLLITIVYLVLFVFFPRPYVTSSFPLQNSNEVGLGSPVYLNFSVPIAIPAQEDLTISPENSFDISLTQDKKTLILTPLYSYQAETKYVLSLSDIKSSRGRKGDDFTLVYTTYSLPRVQSTSPASGATNVSPITELVISFTKPVALDGFSFSIEPTVPLVPVLSSGTTEVSFFAENAAGLLADNHVYTVSLTPQQSSQPARSLGEAFSFSFETRTATHSETSRIDNIANNQDMFENLEQSIQADPYLNLINNVLPYEEPVFKIDYFTYTDKVVVTLLEAPADSSRQAASSFLLAQGINPNDSRITWLSYLVE